MMVKVLLYAYSQSIFSGRKMEFFIQDSKRMDWLCQGYQPSYRTINRFRVDPRCESILAQCYSQFRTQLVAAGEIDEEAIFIDGTKIEANANRYTFVWKKTIQTNQRKMYEKSIQMYKELVHNEIIPSMELEDDHSLSKNEVQSIIDQLDKVIESSNQKLKQESDSAQRKQIRKECKGPKTALKHFTSHQERDKKYDESLEILGNRNSYSKTDHDATFMHLKDNHMNNGQLKPAYNVQIATNNQYVLATSIFPNPTDTRTLIPFVNHMLPFLSNCRYIVADAGYGSEENYTFIEDEALIPYNTLEKEQKRSYQLNPFNIMNWPYSAENDVYFCPNNRPAYLSNFRTHKTVTGFKQELRYYQVESCENCQIRSLCTKSKHNHPRKIQKNLNLEFFKAQVREKLSEGHTAVIYKQRKIDVEVAFGNLKANLGFTRFSVRGNERVRLEIDWAFMVHNLKKWGRKTPLRNKNNKK